MSTLHHFVEANSRWFRGQLPESEATLDAAEACLGISFPQEVRWVLRDYGYWQATGISSLDETVTNTLAAREHLNLPERLVVLYDSQDGGVILLDTIPDCETGQNKVYNVAWESVPDLLEQEIVHPSYLDYVRHVLEQQRNFVAEEDIDYDPTRYHTE